MKKNLIWMTAVLALVAAACGGGDDGDSGGDTSAPTDPRGQELVAMLQADSDFPVSDAEANCTANNMLANLDDTTIDAMLDDVDIDEVECVVSNLIFRKFVKGYISHKNRVVVLSKADPFPPLKTVFAD